MGPFKPITLLFWGARAGCLIHQLTVVGTAMFACVLPASMFESEVGWDYFRDSLIPSPHHGHPAVDLRDIGKIFRVDCPSVAVGQIVTLEFEGRLDRAVLLGRMLPVVLPAPEPGVKMRQNGQAGRRVGGDGPETRDQSPETSSGLRGQQQ